MTEGKLTKNVNNSIIIDCANGIGAIMTKRLIEDNLALQHKTTNFTLINTDIADSENLNKGIGAEFVQKSKQIPRNFEAAFNN